MVLGSGLARLIDAKVGDELVVEARTWPGALNALTFRVSGIVNTDNAALDNLGFIARREGDLASAHACFEGFVAIQRELGDEAGAGWGLIRLSGIAADLGRWTEARAYHEECVRVGRRTGHRELVAFALDGLGRAALIEGDALSLPGRAE